MADIRLAIDRDTAAIEALLRNAGLPTADLASANPLFLVATEGDSLIGVAGIERFGEAALVRSVAVVPAHRSQGVGRALIEEIERRASKEGATQLILLTETARDFFLRAGYGVIERMNVPSAVLASEEFRSLCPQSATCLAKRL
jgi:amino-acid N-acetyltransferase